jgi:N-acetyl-anhydromuramyl-L-alanine amidase AmpD
MNVFSYPLSEGQYIKEETKKTQIYLHHTAGNSSARNTVNWWNSNSDRIATAYVIDGSGEILNCFDDKYWAYHLGLKQEIFTANNIPFKWLDKISIGIEVCNWGYLTKKKDGFYNYVGKRVNDNEVTELAKPFKGFKFWHSYTDAQIQSIFQLLQNLCLKHDIRNTFSDNWAIDKNALNGISGIYTHNSVRVDKSDIYPNPKLIEILKLL